MPAAWKSDAYWQPFFAGYPRAREWLAAVKPDVAIVIYNDHGLNFFLDKMPTFAVGAAHEYRNADEGWGLPTTAPFRGDPELSWHIIEALVDEEFDVTSCQEMLVDHAFTVPLALLWPGRAESGLRTVPICLNTIQHPLPSPMRCFKLGRAIGRAIASYPRDLRVVVLGTGGLSHQLDGQRAGFINKEFDLMCLEKIVADPIALGGSTRFKTSCGSPVRKVSSSSRGSSRAAHSTSRRPGFTATTTSPCRIRQPG